MARRRNVTATVLAAELECDLEDVLNLVRAGRLLVLAPPRHVTAMVPGPDERGGGFDLSGTLAYAAKDLTVWLPAYLATCPPMRDEAAAILGDAPYFDGIRLYVRPAAMAKILRRQFNPPPRADTLTQAFTDVRASRGRPLGSPGPDVGAPLWWRVPTLLATKAGVAADRP